MEKNGRKAGRPPKMNADVVSKVEDGFSHGLTVKQACFKAGISPDTLYRYMKDNPGYSERIEGLRENVGMLARLNLHDSIASGDINTSLWYLERHDKSEFSKSENIALTASGDLEKAAGDLAAGIAAYLAE